MTLNHQVINDLAFCGGVVEIQLVKICEKMEATVVQTGKVQTQAEKKADRVDVFRYQKWVDGDGRLWIVMLTFGHDGAGRFGTHVELLDVDNESVFDVKRTEFEEWVRTGTLKRVDTPILL